MHYLNGQDRHQVMLFSSLDEWVDKQHYIRLIDLLADRFVEDYAASFSDKGQQTVGRKAYHPAMLLKLYMYCYLNSINSSRKIEKECGRNMEVMWLTGRLQPDHKTISDFRKEKGQMITAVLQGFTRLLKEAGYIQGQTVSIDGTKIRANANLSVDIECISKRLVDIDSQLSAYLQELDQADSSENELEQLNAEKAMIQTQVVALQQELARLSAQKKSMEEQGLKRLNLTDEDARIMKSRNGKHFCYNVQAAVDAHHHMIICTDTTSQENDKGLLTPMVEKTTATISTLPAEVLADAGYYLLSQIENLEQQHVNCFVAINPNQQQQQQAAGIDFHYHADKDAYECTEGQWLFPKYGIKKDSRRGTEAQLYQGITCGACDRRQHCTNSPLRSIHRFSNQLWRDTYVEKMKSREGKAKLGQRKALSEHPFGTIKYWMGQIPILLRGKAKVQTEINIYVLAYNFKRLTQIARFEEIQQMIKVFNWKLA